MKKSTNKTTILQYNDYNDSGKFIGFYKLKGFAEKCRTDTELLNAVNGDYIIREKTIKKQKYYEQCIYCNGSWYVVCKGRDVNDGGLKIPFV